MKSHLEIATDLFTRITEQQPISCAILARDEEVRQDERAKIVAYIERVGRAAARCLNRDDAPAWIGWTEACDELARAIKEGEHR